MYFTLLLLSIYYSRKLKKWGCVSVYVCMRMYRTVQNWELFSNPRNLECMAWSCRMMYCFIIAHDFLYLVTISYVMMKYGVCGQKSTAMPTLPCALIQLFTAAALIQLKSFPLLWCVSIQLMTWPLGPFENSFRELLCLDKFEDDVHCGIAYQE